MDNATAAMVVVGGLMLCVLPTALQYGGGFKLSVVGLLMLILVCCASIAADVGDMNE